MREENQNQPIANSIKESNNINTNIINNNTTKEIVLNREPIPSTNRSEHLSDNEAKFQHYLKYLYKNNFVSLTYVS